MSNSRLVTRSSESEVFKENLRVLIQLLIILCSPISLAYLMHILTK